jgi:hypothetical protein
MVLSERTMNHANGLCRVLVISAPLAALVCFGCAKTESGWLGISMHLGHSDYGGEWTSAKPTALDREIYFDLVRQIGKPNVRDVVMSWYLVETTPGQAYDFTVADDLARLAGDADVDLLAVCSVIPNWAAANETAVGWDFGVPAEEQVPRFEQFVRTFVERYDGDGHDDMPGLMRPIHSYEFMNAPEGIPVDTYATWLKRFYTCVKASDPEAIVVLGSLSSPGCRAVDRPQGDYPSYFERLMVSPALAGAAFPYFDVVGFECYPERYPGREPFVDAYRYIQEVLADHAMTCPVWLTEFGAQNANDQPAELVRQADAIVRYAVGARALGVERAYLHCLWDYRVPGSPDVVQHFGLVEDAPSGTRPQHKPAFNAFVMLYNEIPPDMHIDRITAGLYAIENDNGKQRGYVAWYDDVNPRLTGTPVRDGWWQVKSLNGALRTEHGSSLSLSQAPVFLMPAQSPFLRPM